MKVELIAYTQNPEMVIATAAKLCYSKVGVADLQEKMSAEDAAKFVEMLAGLGHESPMEHAVFTFAIEGVSRSLLAQITRHRIASFSVQSQRYVELDEFEYITPPNITEDENTQKLFDKAMEDEAKIYRDLSQQLFEKHKEVYIENGMTEKQATQKAKKQAIEDARFVLPNACTTKMVATFNARSLHNFFRLRCCERAQWEIHQLADEMLVKVKEVAPTLFISSGPACASGPCSEGKMSCGKMDEVRKKYKNLVNTEKEGG